MKKIIGIALVLCMILSVFAAGSSEKSQGPIKIVWWQIGSMQRDHKLVMDELNAYLKEKINVELELKYADWGEYAEKISKIINTGEPYDICFTTSWVNPFAENALKGAYYPIDSLLDTAAPELKKTISPVLWAGAKIDNKIYAVPTAKDNAFAPYWVFNKNDLAALNLKAEDYEWHQGESAADNMKRLEKAFAVFKKAYPNKYPLMLSKDGWTGIFDDFDMLGGYLVGMDYNQKAGKFVCPLETKPVQDIWDILCNWNKLGYINADAATLQEGPKVLFLFGGHGFPYADVAAWSGNFPAKAVLRFAPYMTTGSTQGSMNAISAHSKHPKEALKLLELINIDPKARNLLGFGIEGKHYKKTGPTSMEWIDKKGYDVPTFTQGTFFTLYSVDPAPPEMWAAVKKFNETVPASPILGFIFNPQAVETEIALVKAEFTKYDAFIRIGLKTRAEIYEPMMKALRDAGLKKIIDEANRQLAAWKKAK